MATGVIDRYSMWVPVSREQALAKTAQRAVPHQERRRRTSWGGVTPEIYFNKRIDNSRLVRVADVNRSREIAMFAVSVCLLFVLTLVYAWQHFSAVEYGYRIEAQRVQRDSLVEENRALHLEEASLRDPERIDMLARKMGLQAPQAGQVMHMEGTAEPSGPVMAKASEISVLVSAN
ncbi:MAG TPA: cell division protein FtsL [Terriglobales bacterium]